MRVVPVEHQRGARVLRELAALAGVVVGDEGDAAQLDVELLAQDDARRRLAPDAVAVASTMASGLGCWRAASAVASQALASAIGSAGRGSGSRSLKSSMADMLSVTR